MRNTHRTVLAALLLLVFFSEVAAADVIRLRTGEVVKGRPLQARSDENVLVVEDLLSGALRSLSWDTVDAADRERLRAQWRLTDAALASVWGHRLRMETMGGETTDYLGLLLGTRDNHHRLLQGGRVLKIPVPSTVSVEPELMDPRDIWSPDQLVTRFLKKLRSDGADLDDLTAMNHFRLAEHARIVGALEVAREHYAACAYDESFLSAHIARRRLAEVEALLRHAEALRALRAARVALGQRSFRRARELLEKFASDHAQAGEELRGELEKTRKLFLKKRADHLQKEAKIRFPKVLLKRIKAKVREPDVALSDVLAWTRRELPDAGFEALAGYLRRWDDVTPEEARVFWENRGRSSWRTATYGSGTFIVEPPKLAPAKKRPNTGGPTARVRKPPTRDQWWQRASPAGRASWVMAFFAENSDLFEVSARPKRRPCPTCGGDGIEKDHVCSRCAGALTDKRVRFR